MKSKFLVVSTLFFLVACSSKIDSASYTEFQGKGNKVSMNAQVTLLKNVGASIKKGGPEYAVEFCNLEASGIIDSLNEQYSCTISRISEKNRNVNASLKTKMEKDLWHIFNQGNLADTLIINKNDLVFYKPIKIGMPACLKCHGDKASDINTATLQKLQTLYPKDLATGYALGDFRGLWKIEFKRE